ncbi:hypothetical protein FNV43_RR00577 [Rhamnella rubrinervis]|uniref:Protein kinase domain-containing protein n=1 Tax=Rhamnella rubrinervis TaxID=2594499 RepID=A0A8K0HPE9_9ROSA|nr:hypothetical protein FNV43_RR00577 [Rhamnella rubrinervis]
MNNFSGLILDFISNASQLTKLDVAVNSFSGSLPNTIGKLRNLEWLSLSTNNFISADSYALNGFFTSLANCKDLTSLDLTNNQFMNSMLPNSVGNISSLKYFAVTNCITRGNIPSDFGNLTSLEILALDYNELSGSIPPSIMRLRKLQGLELLDLSRNNLSGVIPWSLETISRLYLFNVSFNHLRGEIPNGGPFAKLSSSSFMQNDGLCGAPQLGVLPYKTRVTKRSNAWKYIAVGVVTSAVFTIAMLIMFFWMRNKNSNAEDTNLLSAATMREISHKELIEATDRFAGTNLLGTGSSASVYRGKLNIELNIAVKVFNFEHETALTRFHSECEVLFNLRHINLIRIISIHNSRIDFKALILEYVPPGSLEIGCTTTKIITA